MSTSFTGPVKNRVRFDNDRAWYSGLPIGHDPDLVEYFNDFLFAQDYSATDWTITNTDAGATEALTADALNGSLLLTNTAADNDVVQLQSAEESYKLSAGKQVWFATSIKCSDATQSDIFVGFATTDTSIIAGTTDSVGFRKPDGAATWETITEDATVETLTTGVATLVASTYMKLAFHWDGVNKVRFYVNNALVATHTANIEQTNQLALTMTLQNGEAVAKTMTIDYIYVAQER